MKFSSILAPESIQKLNKLCSVELEEWSLVYRASRDGFNAKNFHKSCDGIANTLTVIESTNGNIFGGFTEKAWNSNEESTMDRNAFIFSLANAKNKPFKAFHREDKCAVHGSPDFGPIFASEGFDKWCISISSDSNVNNMSCSDLGHKYKREEYPCEFVNYSAILGDTIS